MFARLSLIGFFLLLPATVEAQAFADLPQNHPNFAAAQYLKNAGILQGYEDGTFRPDAIVNRAEAMKIIVSNRTETALSTGTTVFTDVPVDAWFAPYATYAYETLRIIDGPPATRFFRPEQPVTRSEFLKMLLLAHDVDPVSSYGEMTYPIASDTAQSTDWFYPYMRYALTTSMVEPQKTLLLPAEQLARGDMAHILYNFLLYREGKRTQTLLSSAENEILTVFRMMENGAHDEASFAAARAMLAARGALASQPDEAIAKATVKTAEASYALAQAAQMLAAGSMSDALDLSGTAWHLAEKGRAFSSSLSALAGQVQKAATGIADEARK